MLPFSNLTGDLALDIYAEGLAEDLIDRMARLRWLPIIARSSSFAFRGLDVDARAAGKELGARYVFEGRVKPIGGGISLAASLSDSETGQLIWSNRINLPKEHQSDALNQLITGLAATLGVKIEQQEQSLVLSKPQSDLNVRDLIWRGRWYLNNLSRKSAAKARQCFEEALAREPGSSEAIIQLAIARFYELWTGRGSAEEIKELRQMAQRAIIADLEDARGHMIAGIAEMWLRQPLRAEALLARAIELNPSQFLAYGQMGSLLYLRGEPKKALNVLETAMRLSPNDFNLFYVHGEMAMAHLMVGQYEQAVSCADLAIMTRQSYWYAHVVKINALKRFGDRAGAEQASHELNVTVPQFDPAHTDWLPFVDPAWNEYLRDGLNF